MHHHHKKGRNTLHAMAEKAMHGTLTAALLFWKNLKVKLEEWDFVEN